MVINFLVARIVPSVERESLIWEVLYAARSAFLKMQDPGQGDGQ